MPCGKSGQRNMEMDKRKSYRLSRTSSVVAVAGFLAFAVGGYLTYQSGGPLEASSELPLEPALPAPVTEGTTAPDSAAEAASTPGSQMADANAPAGILPNQGSRTQLPSIDRWRAGTQPRGQVDGRAALTNSDIIATEPAVGFPENARSRPTSLPTNEIGYVLKARANIRSKPSVDARLVGQADRGSKLTIVARDGKWTQVERGATRGWVSGNLLGPHLP
jgi:Bacterial SH3 domain